MSDTDTADSQPTQGLPPPAPAESAAKVSQAFLASVQKWVAGAEKPAQQASSKLVDDLKAVVAERDTIVKQGQEADKTLREAQATLAHHNGKIEGLVTALHSLEGETEG